MNIQKEEMTKDINKATNAANSSLLVEKEVVMLSIFINGQCKAYMPILYTPHFDINLSTLVFHFPLHN